MSTHLADGILSLARAAVYSTPILHVAGPLLRRFVRTPDAAARHWDAQLADRLSPYLGGTLGIDMRKFDPVPRGPFDVIVFNEVLYYVDVDEAAAQLHRYAAALARSGVLVVGMKDDPKSGAILSRVVREFRWETAVLLQEQRAPGGFAVRMNRERPAYLVSVVRPLEGDR